MSKDELPDDRRVERAPQGAQCAMHPDRDAVFTCPRCGSYVCMTCFHVAVARCDECMRRDPTEAAPPLPWETREGSALGRFARTLGSAFSPMRTAPAMAREAVAPAFRFFLLTALPLALLAGVVPHTRTLLFRGQFVVELLGQPSPSSGEIAFDIARAMLAQLALSGVELACLYFPYTSLVRAYAPARYAAAQRVVLYRFWLMPGTLALIYFGVAAFAPEAEEAGGSPVFALLMMARLLLPVFLLVAMGSVARVACGLSTFKSMLVVIVPMLLLLVAQPLSAMGVSQLLPPQPELPSGR